MVLTKTNSQESELFSTIQFIQKSNDILNTPELIFLEGVKTNTHIAHKYGQIKKYLLVKI